MLVPRSYTIRQALRLLLEDENSIAIPAMYVDPPKSETWKLKRCAGPKPLLGTTESAVGIPPAVVLKVPLSTHPVLSAPSAAYM